jgi:hypothetical protein
MGHAGNTATGESPVFSVPQLINSIILGLHDDDLIPVK